MEGFIVEPGEVEVAGGSRSTGSGRSCRRRSTGSRVVVVRIEDEELEVKDNVDDEASVVV